MQQLKLRLYPDPFLRKPSEKIKKVKETHIRVAVKMHELMNSYNGLGLSAPQAGVPFAIIVINTMKYPNGIKRTMYNPEILNYSKETFQYNEGCLSFPDEFFETTRPKNIMIKYINSQNEEIIETFEDLNAICIQHEVDHLNGKLFIDLFKET